MINHRNISPQFKGSNFLLRQSKPSDIEDRLRIGKSREFVLMCGGNTDNLKPLTREQMKNWYKRMCEREYGWVIEYDNRCIGGMRLTLNKDDRNAMYAVGIFDEAMLGRGIGTEATRLILDFAFNELKLHRVQLRVLEYNKRAIACYKKAGFTVEGTLRENAFINGNWENDLMMGILESEYNERKTDD